MKKEKKGVVKFPEKLYVYREEDGEDVYYICQETAEECMSSGDDEKLVGIYERKEMKQLVVKVEEFPAIYKVEKND